MSNKVIKEYDFFNIPFQTKDYDPTNHGVVEAMRIYFGGENRVTPYAELTFAFGGTCSIRWDDVTNRELFSKGVNAYTVIFDERTKFKSFEVYKQSALLRAGIHKGDISLL